MDRQTQAYVYAAITVLLWSTVAAAFKITLHYLTYVEMLLLSSFVSVLTLGAILIGQRKIRLLRRCTFQDCLRSVLFGFLNPFLYYLILFKAYELLPAQEAQPLNYTWPLMLVILAALIKKERISFRQLIAILISFLGVLVISTHGDVLSFRVTNLAGALLALGSSVIWALYWLFNVRDKREEAVKLFLNFLFGFIFTLLLAVIATEIRMPPLSGLLGAAYIGLFEMGITFFVWMKALSLARTTAQVSNLIYLAPFISLLFIHSIVGEPIRSATICGLILIVCGILFQEYGFGDNNAIKFQKNIDSDKSLY